MAKKNLGLFVVAIMLMSCVSSKDFCAEESVAADFSGDIEVGTVSGEPEGEVTGSVTYIYSTNQTSEKTDYEDGETVLSGTLTITSSGFFGIDEFSGRPKGNASGSITYTFSSSTTKTTTTTQTVPDK